jgi:hypothetical protein
VLFRCGKEGILFGKKQSLLRLMFAQLGKRGKNPVGGTVAEFVGFQLVEAAAVDSALAYTAHKF